MINGVKDVKSTWKNTKSSSKQDNQKSNPRFYETSSNSNAQWNTLTKAMLEVFSKSAVLFARNSTIRFSSNNKKTSKNKGC